ncbi:MAG TPA: serine hydrolase domain-containing protein [Candidatus Eremiobacteraceae bacterium]|nr:serine hydrolase domain-containing protein [Candidatus Eremiobacteraceae bacterium]
MPAVLLALIFLTAAPPNASSLGARVDEIVRETMIHQHLPGLSLAIARRGTVLYARGYGYRDLAHRIPADAKTVYNIASNTKQFTATAIMLLQQDGKLRLHDRLSRYLPEFRHGAQIGLVQLLTHTSGIPDYADLPNLPHRATAKEFVDLVRNAPLDFPPGSTFEYSNTNFVILGMIVEQVSGMSYQTFVARRIFNPIGMTSASTRVTPQSQPDGAIGYTFDGKVVAAPQTPDDLGYGDGTVNASVLDLVKWDRALEGGAVVDAASWQAMTHAPLTTGYGPRGGYGYGLDLSTLYGHREISHEGFNVGFASVNATFPDDGLEIVALSNGDPFDEDLFVKRVFALLAPPSPAQLAADMKSAPGEDPVITTAAKRLVASMQTGRVDASTVTAGLAKDLTPARARQLCSNTGALGSPARFIYHNWQYRDRVKIYSYEAYFPNAIVAIDVTMGPHEKIASIDLARED